MAPATRSSPCAVVLAYLKAGCLASSHSHSHSHSPCAVVLAYLKAGCLVAASGGKEMGSRGAVANATGLNGEELNEAAGLVGTHGIRWGRTRVSHAASTDRRHALDSGRTAYSILDARELGLIPGLGLGNGLLGQTKLIKLRNPWGCYEWKVRVVRFEGSPTMGTRTRAAHARSSRDGGARVRGAAAVGYGRWLLQRQRCQDRDSRAIVRA